MAETLRAECDYPYAATVSMIDGTCRCLVCSRCGHHTGNATQGHYWAACSVTKTNRGFHFCCPGACELESTSEGG